MGKKTRITATDLFLFDGMDGKEAERLLAKICPQIESVPKGTVLSSGTTCRQRMGFVLYGRCLVLHCREKSEDLPMNILYPADSFGILSLFSDADYPTTVMADSDVRVLFFTKSDILTLMSASSTVSENLMKFLCSRVIFLNRKVQTLAAKDAPSKLAAWLLCTNGDRENTPFPFHATEAARMLGCGRASVYRALDALQEDGAVLYTDRTVSITDKTRLERIAKS